MPSSLTRSALTLACATATATALAAVPATAFGLTEGASSGVVSAAFIVYQPTTVKILSETLIIDRSGQIVYDAPVAAPPLCPQNSPCAPLGGGFKPSLHVVDLEPGGDPDVVLDLYTGGAHCCTVEQIFSFDPGVQTYVPTTRDFGDAYAPLEDLGHNGRYEFVTADDSFAYRFTDYADSGLPLEILTYADHHFTNVTRHYPKLIAKDAAGYFRDFERDRRDGDGLIAAWAADEDNLGHRALVSRILAEELKAGNLRSPMYRNPRKFIAALKRFLRKERYVH